MLALTYSQPAHERTFFGISERDRRSIYCAQQKLRGRRACRRTRRRAVGSSRIRLMDGLQWQLAEDHADFSGNPFVPRCYAAGFYPFVFGNDTVMLFCFETLAKTEMP